MVSLICVFAFLHLIQRCRGKEVGRRWCWGATSRWYFPGILYISLRLIYRSNSQSYFPFRSGKHSSLLWLRFGPCCFVIWSVGIFILLCTDSSHHLQNTAKMRTEPSNLTHMTFTVTFPLLRLSAWTLLFCTRLKAKIFHLILMLVSAGEITVISLVSLAK